MIQRHQTYTKSAAGGEDFGELAKLRRRNSSRCMPKDYKRVLESIKRSRQSQGLSGDEAIMAAFEENTVTSPASAADNSLPDSQMNEDFNSVLLNN